MESPKIEEIIDDKYIIKEQIGIGGTSDVFLVIDKITKKEYAAKVLVSKEEKHFDKEVEILKLLKNKNSPYIIKMIDYGEGDVVRNKIGTRRQKYMILEYCMAGSLHDYIVCYGESLGELRSKLLFSKILEGIQVSHELNICNRDIKLDNILILIGENVCPKICDFGFACTNKHDLEDFPGTDFYYPPEILEGEEYDGIKADIFCLGQSLMILTVGIYGFREAKDTNRNYKFIKNKDNIDIKYYWKSIQNDLTKKRITLSDEFKDLFIKMVTYNPEKRPTVEKILQHAWFNEINELKKDKEKIEKLEKLENEIKEIFNNLVDKVKEHNKKEIKEKILKRNIKNLKLIKKSGEDDNRKMYFPLDSKAQSVYTPLNINYCIKIKGDLNPAIFMSDLYYGLIDKFKNVNNFIEKNMKNEKELILNVSLEEKEEELPEEVLEELKKLTMKEESKEKENDENVNELSMEIKLYKYSDEHILRFVLKNGNRFSFMEKFEEISKLVENIIS